MIEKIVYDYWKAKETVPGYVQVPKTVPKQHIRIEKTGSSEENRLKHATIVIQSYAESIFAAATLNETVKTRMSKIVELKDVASCECETDYNFTDTETKQYRYQAVFSIYYY